VAAFLQHVLNGLSLGAIYALIALGYTMVFGVLQLINFAHGDIVMVGSFVALYASRWMHVGDRTKPSWTLSFVLLLLAMVVCALLGYVIERFAYRPLRKQSRITALITAIGISLLLENGGQLLFGATPQAPAWIPSVSEIQIAGADVSPVQLVTLLAALGLMVGLEYIVYRTRLGLAMRAVSHDPQVALLMGINIDGVISFTFMLGSALAAAAGILYTLRYPKVEPFMGLLPGLKAFVAAVLGGIGNVPGAMLGGIVLGLSEEMVAGYVSSSLRDAFAFSLLIGVLLFRPNGLLGSTAMEKV
jgi:branched-chain amino acid transport system permease protein